MHAWTYDLSGFLSVCPPGTKLQTPVAQAAAIDGQGFIIHYVGYNYLGFSKCPL